MSVPQTTPLNLGLSGALSRLGIKGGLIPDVLPGLQPVLIMGDIHASLSSEIVESRLHTYNAWSSSAAPTHWPFMQIQVLAAGGIVIEELVASIELPSSVTRMGIQTLAIGVDVVPAAPKSPPFTAQIGGYQTVSPVRFGNQLAPPALVGVELYGMPLPEVSDSGADSFLWGKLSTRLYVAPGKWVTLFASPGLDWTTAITFRELSDIQGEP